MYINLGWDNEVSSDGAYALGKNIGALKNLQYLKISIGSDNEIKSHGLIGIC